METVKLYYVVVETRRGGRRGNRRGSGGGAGGGAKNTHLPGVTQQQSVSIQP